MNANVGMVHPVAAPVSAYVPGASITYGTGFVVSEARSAALNWERTTDSNFYGDDIELDSDNGIRGYTLDFEPTGLQDDARNKLLGETVNSGEYTITDAAAPEVGFGFVRVMRASNGSGVVNYSYEGWWFYRIRFGLDTEETRTKEQNIDWRTPTLTGNGMGAMLDSSGNASYAVHKTFSTAGAAIAYIEGKANISSATTEN